MLTVTSMNVEYPEMKLQLSGYDVCWALLFTFKLRFPPGVSIATCLKRVKLTRNPKIDFQLVIKSMSPVEQFCEKCLGLVENQKF
jgi:hypothetical protein